MFQSVRTILQRINRLPRHGRTGRCRVALHVDALEERCTPAALFGPIQPPIAVMVVTQFPLLELGAGVVPAFAAAPQVAHDAPVPVRTDLFGGAYDDSAPSEEDELLAIQEPFASADLKPRHQRDAEPPAPPAEGQRVADDAPTKMPESEQIILCVVVEYD